MAAILVLTLTPLGAGTEDEPGRDLCALGLPCPLGHLVLFALLGTALAGSYATSDAARRSPRRTLVMLLLAVWLFAALDEFAQERVGRGAQLGDWLADMVGALAGMLGGSVLPRALLARRR